MTMDKYDVVLKELAQCVYGTIVDREPGEGSKRQKHLKDGWRDGHSKPFKTGAKVYDLVKEYNGKTKRIELSDKTYSQFEALKVVIETKRQLEALPADHPDRKDMEAVLKEFQSAGYDVKV